MVAAPACASAVPAGLEDQVGRVSQSCYSQGMSWLVVYHPDALVELGRLPTNEQAAIVHAVEKLESRGPNLGHPHSSSVKIAVSLRELRPRAGRSPWRAFYRRMGTSFVVGAIGPEANVDGKGFGNAVAAAEQRIDQVRDDA